ITPATNEEERLATLNGVRRDDSEPMFPERAVHFIGSQPRLRRHFQHVTRVAFVLDGLNQLEVVIRVRCGDVAVEGRGWTLGRVLTEIPAAGKTQAYSQG